MIKRLARFAELKLQSLCADAGALCHGVDEDESGWDCLIEFPEKTFAGPADTRPPRSIAYAQVKSVVKPSLLCRIKLSNALRAAHSPQPWFVVLMTGPTHKQSPRVYAVHVWGELIRRTLEAVRLAESENRPLHKSSLTIRFQPGHEKSVDLVQWMQDAIDVVGAEYEVAKREINRTAGYEDGYGSAVTTIEASSVDEIMKNFLGLGEGLHLNRFTFTPSRFGISLPFPQIDASSGTLHVTPEPAGEAEIRLRSPASSRTIVLPGHVYDAGIPGVLSNRIRFRFSAKFLELLWGDGDHVECQFKINGRNAYPLATFEDYASLNEWFAAGPINLQVWSKEGRRLIDGRLEHKNTKSDWNWTELSSALRLLRSIAGHEQVKVSLNDLSLASGLKTFADVSGAGSLRIESEPLSEAPVKPFTTMLYWYHIDVGDYAFYAMTERSVAEDIIIDGKRRITTDVPRCVESYVLTKPSESGRKMMENDYELHLARLKEAGLPLGLADLREYIAACAAAQNSARRLQ